MLGYVASPSICCEPQASLAFMSVFTALIFRRHVSEDDTQANTAERRKLTSALAVTIALSALFSLSYHLNGPRRVRIILACLLGVAILAFSTGKIKREGGEAK